MSRLTFPLTLAVLTASCLLTSHAQAEEWATLFDGKTLKGWDVLKCEAEVKDGAVFLKAGNGLVQTKKQYGDFVLEFEWKALKADNWDSGVYFRYTDVPKNRPWPGKYQVNLRKGMEGNLASIAKAKNEVAVKPHEWNRFQLTVKGAVASLKVGDKQAWKIDGIKVPRGYIALQAEIPGGGQFLFRKIRIQELKK